MTLRNLLVRRLRGLDRDQAANLVKAGGVYVNRLRVRLPMVRMAPGERVTVYRRALEVRALAVNDLSIVYRDPSFMVLDKRSGVPVAPTRSSARGTLTEALIEMLKAEGVERPYVGVLHRLDRGASGLVILTTRGAANASFHRQFLTHEIRRTYRVLVSGEPPEAVRCDAPLLLLQTGGVKIASAGEPSAKPARTRFRRVGVRTHGGQVRVLVEAEIETGRTHQIRAHAAHLGFPVVGDRRYGATSSAARPAVPSDLSAERGLCLHAWRLGFAHPHTGEALELESPLPRWAEPESD
ncbi:MAG: RluA family pseudouridine synthase [Nannocystaceae bacterium]